MKKLFTFAAAMMMTIGLYAADNFYALADMTVVGNTYTSATFSGEKAKNNNTYIELPAASVSGTIAFWGQSDKTDRFLYIYGTNGTVQDTGRPITMLAAGDTIDYTSDDIIIVNETPYLRFSTADDFKFTKFEYTAEGVAPSTDPVESAEISGATEVFVGYGVELTCTAAKANAYQWYVNGAAVEGATAKKYAFTAEAEGSYSIYCTATNDYTATPVQSNTLVVVATIKPAATACANVIPASAGTNPTEVGTEIDLDVNSEGGKIFVAGMKNTDGSSIVYNALGLGLMKGGADSVRIEFNNFIAEGSVITIKMAAGGTGNRGLKLQTPSKSTLLDASWAATEAGEVREFEYTVPAGSPLIGDYRILLARNNSVYLQSVQMGDCGEARDIPADTDPELKVSLSSVDLNLTAANPNPTASVVFSGKNLTAGTYNLVVPNLAGLTVTPTAVTVGEDGKLNAEVTLAYTSAVDVEAASSEISLTINEITKSVVINYSAELAKNYISASVNIEQWILDNGTNTDAYKAVLDAANIEYNNIDALDTLNETKDNRNYAFLGLKLKKNDAALRCWLEAGHSIAVKFGNVGADFKVIANGVEQTLTAADYANTTVEGDKVLTLANAPVDMYLEIVCNSTKTLVVKQIMLDEPVAAIELPEPSPVTGFINTNAAVKAVKVVRNGQLFIEKNGVIFNAQGAIVK